MSDGAAEAKVASLSTRLREATRAEHEDVEHGSRINQLIVLRIPAADEAPDAVEAARRRRALAEYREVYRFFLVAAHGFESAVTSAVAASPAFAQAEAAGFFDEAPASTELIRADLAEVFGADAARGLPAMDALPVPTTLAELAGMEYVRRGSRAGGAVIGAAVAHNLGFTRESGASFLLRYGRDTRRVLGEFKSWLDALELDEERSGDAVSAARETFRAVGRWQAIVERGIPVR